MVESRYVSATTCRFWPRNCRNVPRLRQKQVAPEVQKTHQPAGKVNSSNEIQDARVVRSKKVNRGIRLRGQRLVDGSRLQNTGVYQGLFQRKLACTTPQFLVSTWVDIPPLLSLYRIVMVRVCPTLHTRRK